MLKAVTSYVSHLTSRFLRSVWYSGDIIPIIDKEISKL